MKRTVLNLERLEEREVLSATDWFGAHLADANIAALARVDYSSHSAINYNDMLAIYSQVEKVGRVSSAELSSLQVLASNSSALNTPDSVAYLSRQVIGQNAANNSYQLQHLGDLTAGSSAAQLQLLVGKWFLGQDHPLVEGGQGITAVHVNGSLFGNGGPSYKDVAQGAALDCELMASLAETAARDTGAIQSMFTADGNNVWTVRFYENGAAVYVTVDNVLPVQNGNAHYDRPQNGVLWAALAEKAYAELNAFDPMDGVQQQLQGANSYTSLKYLDAARVLPTLTDRAGHSTNSPSGVAAALAQGNLIVLGTGESPGASYIEADHAYAVISYNASTKMFTLFNPWGVNGGTDKGYKIAGTITASAAFLEAHFNNVGGWVGAAQAAAPFPTIAPAVVSDAVFTTYAAPAAPVHADANAARQLGQHHQASIEGANHSADEAFIQTDWMASMTW